MDFLLNFLFSDGGYSPHGFCIAWNKPVLYTHITADLLIAVSYFAIPAVMLIFLRKRRDSRLHGPAMLFVIFISACGLSHLMSIVTMYLPYYGLQGALKLFTGIVSMITAVALWKLMPGALKIPSPDLLMEALEEKEIEIAERAQAQQQMAESQRQLDQKVIELEATNEELKEFAYAASHDLKSPANTLSLWLQDFEEECGKTLTPDQRENVTEARAILQRMRHLVDDILSYARVVNNDVAEARDVNLEALFRAALEDMKEDVNKARATVEIGPLATLKGFPSLLSILAHNLLGNSIKFRSADRPLRIAVSGWYEGPNDQMFVLSVKDNGIGINPEYHDRIFKLFKKLHRPDDYEGTGLGLALCRRLAVTHGGTISVMSQEGQGAEFRILFPMEGIHATQAA